MSTNNTGWVVTNGHHYITENSCKGLTDNVQEARFWKKEKSAQNILAQLQTKKKSPLVGFYVCFIGVNTNVVERNTQHNPNNNMMNGVPISTPKTCADMEKAQIYQQRICENSKLIKPVPAIPGLKAMLKMKGVIKDDTCRRPFRPLTLDEYHILEKALDIYEKEEDI